MASSGLTDKQKRELKTGCGLFRDAVGIPDAVATKTDVDSVSTEVSDLTTNLASTANGKGASLIGVEDSGALLTATDVEAALAELAGLVGAGVAGLLDVKGGYDAATNTPDLDTSPSGVLKGDAYYVTDAGNFFTEAVEAGDVLFANQDSPTLLTHWTRIQKNVTAATTTTPGVVELATDGENAADVVVQGNDSRLSDARTPLSHAASHTDGTDDIQSATNAQKGLATAAQITSLEANAAHVAGDGSDHADVATNTAAIAAAVTDTGAGAGNSDKLVKLDGSGLLDGRDVGADGTKLDGIEAAADVTDRTNVTAAVGATDADAVAISAGAGDDGKLVKLDPGGALDISMMPTSVAKEAVAVLSAADLRALHTTPFELAPAPGAGLYLELISATVIATFGTVALDDAVADGNLRFKTGTGGVQLAIQEADGLVDLTTGTEVRHVRPDAPSATQDVTPQNESIVLDNDGAAFTGATADTTMVVSTRYRVLSLV